MKKYLLPSGGQFYKANLHCHSILTDGRKTPAELKEIYKKLGYSIIAYTDHDIMIPHHELTDENFLALTGFEAEFNEFDHHPSAWEKTCHICFIALSPDMDEQPCWHEKYAYIDNAKENRDKVKVDASSSPFEREYSCENVNKMIEIARERGFFVTYNHPTWSQENYEQYMGYTGMHAMEMFNGASTALGYEEYNPRVYDDMLRGDKRIFCVAGDDNHNAWPIDDPKCDQGVAYTMIKAENLSYRTIAKALENGDFYTSMGPEIKALWYEDGKVHIECSDAQSVFCVFGIRHRGRKYCENGVPVREAEFEVPQGCGYFRLTVVDKAGNRACTNAYFEDEL